MMTTNKIEDLIAWSENTKPFRISLSRSDIRCEGVRDVDKRTSAWETTTVAPTIFQQPSPQGLLGSQNGGRRNPSTRALPFLKSTEFSSAGALGYSSNSSSLFQITWSCKLE